MRGERPAAAPGTNPIADEFLVKDKRGSRFPVVRRRPATLGRQRFVRHSDRWNLQRSPQMQG